MRFGINTFLFACPFRNRDCRWFGQFRKWGYESVEIAIAAPGDMDAARVRAELDRNRLIAGTVAGAFGPGRDLRGTQAEQRATIAYMRAVFDEMDQLGSRRIIGPLYSATGRAEPATASERRSQWRQVVRHLRTLADEAGERDIEICVEPLNRFETDFLNTTEQALDLAADVDRPSFRIMLDTFHMNIEEKDLGAAIRRCGRLLGHLHASGTDRGTPGNDHTDWTSIAAALKAIHYQGDVVVESFTSDVEVIARAAAIWRKMEPSREAIVRDGLKFLRRTLR